MEIILAKTAGFCFGVNNAIKTLDRAIEEKEGLVYTLGDIIHNKQVVDYYKKRGVKVAHSVEEIREGSCVVIRAHGVSLQVIEELKLKNVLVYDATCPYVKKIQRLVQEKYREGKEIVILGSKEHPEVIGINGYCSNRAHIVEDASEVDKVEVGSCDVCVVSQTTQSRDELKKVFEISDKVFKNALKFDTICNATSKRQEEAKEIAREVDLMIIVGGANSSNTNKLFEVASKYCKNTVKIEDVSCLDIRNIKNIKKIGITAGASTPEWVIKEVLDKMEENKEKELGFEELFEQSLVELHTGDVVEGTVIGFNDKEAYIDLGYKSDGVIAREQYSTDPNFTFKDNLKVGDKVRAFVINVNDREGNVMLSKIRVDRDEFSKELDEYLESKKVISVTVSEVVKGGVVAVYKGVRIFIPGSRLSDKYVQDLSKYLNKNIDVRIVEINHKKNRVIASARELIEETRKEKLDKFWEGIQVGVRLKGVVKNIESYGVFVNVGEIDGLIHISELDWSKARIKDVVKEGEEIEVEVIDFDKEKGRLLLSRKRCVPNPWIEFTKMHLEGDIVECKIVRFTSFGAFAEVAHGVDGLIHISEISDYRLDSPKEVLKLGQVVKAKIIRMTDEEKLSLSIKAVEPINPREKEEEARLKKEENKEENEYVEGFTNTIADMIKVEEKNKD